MRNHLTILYTESTNVMGGQELATLRYTDGLKKRGHTIIAAVQPDSPLRGLLAEKGIIVETVAMRKWRFPLGVLRLVGLINKYSVDIVQSNGSLDSWLSAVSVYLSWRRPRFIRIRHISAPLNKNIMTSLLYKKIFDRVIVTGEESLKRLLITRDGLDEKKVAAVPIGYDQAIFKPVETWRDLRAELGLPRDQRLVGIIAYLRHYKGHRYFIEAAASVCRQNKNVTFVIIGEGPEEGNIRAQIKTLGLENNVLLLGYREDLLDIYASLDLFVHPSIEAETLPQSILQAMAMGKPVIVTPVGSIHEVIKDGDAGRVVEARDSKALAEAIELLIKDPERMRMMGLRAREIVSRFSVEKGLDRLEGVYDQLLETR